MVQTRIDLTPAQWRLIKALAAERGMPIPAFLALALAKASPTKEAFVS